MLISIFVSEYTEYGHQNDLHIHAEGPVFDVVKVVFDASFYGGIASVAVDLCPACDAGAYLVFDHVAGDIFFEFVYEEGAFGSRAYYGHIADEDVEELWELVDACLAHEASPAGLAGVVLCGPFILFFFVCLDTHGAELVHVKVLAVEAYALLFEEDGTG